MYRDEHAIEREASRSRDNLLMLLSALYATNCYSRILAIAGD